MPATSFVRSEQGLAADSQGIIEVVLEPYHSLFVDSGGAPRVLFVGNRGESRVAAEVLVPGGTELMDALSEQGLAADSQGIIEVVLEPYQVRMLLVA